MFIWYTLRKLFKLVGEHLISLILAALQYYKFSYYIYYIIFQIKSSFVPIDYVFFRLTGIDY
jgi:hypothetical protein